MVRNRNKYPLILWILMLSAFIPGLTSGQTNRGLYMSTYFKYATVPEVNVSGFTGLTIEGWCNIDQYMPFGNATGNPVCVKEPTFSSPYYNYGFILMVLNEQHYQGHNRRLAFGLNFGANGETHIGLHSDHEVPLHEWHHLAGTWDGSQMKVYIDGVLDGTYDVSTLGPIYDPVSLMHFGARLLGNQYAFHFGYIDDFRIWDYARSESEIRETMYREITGSETGLYSYHPLNESSGQIISDSGPNALHGYLGSTTETDINDAALVSSTAPVPYYSVKNGSWHADSTWAIGQSAPEAAWARVSINHEVTIENDVTAEDITIGAGSCIIGSAADLTVQGMLTNNAGFSGIILKSDTSGTASLIEYSGAEATCERYVTDSCWHYVSAPVDDPLAGVFYGMYLKTWDEPAGTWNYITNENEVLSTDMAGYALWSYTAGTVTFTGALNAGERVLNVTHTGPETDPVDDGFNFAGNPYPSALDWNADDGNGWTRTDGNVYNTLWIWNPLAGNYGVYIKDALFGTNDVDHIIPANQGFFVYCSQPSGFIAVNDSARIHDLKDLYKATGNSSPALRLSVTGTTGSDEIILMPEHGASPAFDPRNDALKIRGNPTSPQLFTLSSDKKELVINAFSITEDYPAIPMGFAAGISGSFRLSAEMFPGFGTDTEIVIRDLKEDAFFAVNATGDAYEFTDEAGDHAARFLIYTNGYPGETDYSSGIRIYSWGNEIRIRSGSAMVGTVCVYDVAGRELISASLNHVEQYRLGLSGHAGLVVVRVNDSGGFATEKVWIH